jgi:death-on-curing protein
VRYLTVAEVIELHRRLIAQSGGVTGLRDGGALESSLAQPLQSFAGQELYPSVEEKAAALGYFLISNHPFVDGNKRIGHAAMEVMLVLNRREFSATVDEQERTILAVASGRMNRDEFTAWVIRHVVRGD